MLCCTKLFQSLNKLINRYPASLLVADGEIGFTSCPPCTWQLEHWDSWAMQRQFYHRQGLPWLSMLSEGGKASRGRAVMQAKPGDATWVAERSAAAEMLLDEVDTLLARIDRDADKLRVCQL